MTPRARVLIAVAALAVALAAPPGVTAAVAVVAAVAIVAGGGARHAGRRLRAAALTALIALVLQAWLSGGQAALRLGVRIAAATAISTWLAAAVPAGELVRSLGRLGLPAALVDLILLALRYVDVLGERLRTAREAQRVRLGWQRLGVRLRALGVLAGAALARAVDQSVATGEAMRLRGGR